MRSSVETHLRKFFAGHAAELHAWFKTPTEKRLPGLHILVFAPGPRTSLWTYASVGSSDVRVAGHGLEFLVLAAGPDDAHVELVTVTAHYHSRADGTQRLGAGHTVPLGRPWLPGSRCDHVQVSLPYPFGPELERMQDERGQVQVLWLIPITASERQFKIAHGLEALEAKFDEVGLEYWRANRDAVV